MRASLISALVPGSFNSTGAFSQGDPTAPEADLPPATDAVKAGDNPWKKAKALEWEHQRILSLNGKTVSRS